MQQRFHLSGSSCGMPSLAMAHQRLATLLSLMLAAVLLTGCGTKRMIITESAPTSSVRVTPPIRAELDAAPRLPIPIDTTGIGYRPDPRRGQTRSAPDTVIVFRDAPRADPDESFPLVQATVDSAHVRILGAEMDCVFAAPAYGEKLIITADRNGCDAYVEGQPKQRQIVVPVEDVKKDQGLFARIGELIGDVALVIVLLLGGMILLEVIRMIRRR